MTKNDNYTYLILVGIFITSLIISNLIFQKFFYFNLFGFNLELSVGIIFYPITFLVTDVVSEIFGKQKAKQMVFSGIISTVFCLFVIYLANYLPATEWSPVDNTTFNLVFGNTSLAVGASMFAYLCAQLIDIRIYHFWKKITHGKHLWLRNNLSTIPSQFLDTCLILLLLCLGGAIPWDKFVILFIQGFLFKIIIAIIDTPIIYLCVFYLRKKFNLSIGEELQ
jgi:uncharacterized integral membrane protein (TIGR00697 family)|tara:strand:- start:7629 stop:8297 length:669 start_codon:yes stop_codon:yes gene_type:complete